MDEPFAFFTEDGDITVVGTHDPDHARAVCRADLTATFGTDDLEASITEQPAKIWLGTPRSGPGDAVFYPMSTQDDPDARPAMAW